MEYTISKTRRNALILSSSFIILYILILRLFFYFNGPEKIDPFQIVSQNIIYIVLFGYIMFVFFDYFRHYRLKVLQIVILIGFITEVIFKSNLLTNILESTWKKAIFLTVNAIWILATIVMIAFLFQAKMKDYPGIRSVRKYAISILFFYVLVPTVPLFVEPDSTFSTQQLVEIIFVIPYVFVIDFAMKLPSK